MADSKILDEMVTVRLPSNLRDELQRIADADDRPISSVVRRIVKRALENDREGAAA
jgi:predicted transcriptional regulator